MTNTNSSSDTISFPLYPEDYPIDRDLGFGFRIISTFAIVIFSVLLGIIHIALCFFTLFLLWILRDRYFRKLLRDWPKNSHFIGELHFTDVEIQVKRRESETFKINKNAIKECLYFINFYKNHSINHRDFYKTGNASLFIQLEDSSMYLKFNIPDEKSYLALLNQMENLKEICPLVKMYGIEDPAHILTDDMTKRRIFK